MVSVLLVIPSDYNYNQIVLNSLQEAGHPFQLLVYNNGCPNQEIIDELSLIASVFLGNSIIESTYSTALNELLVHCSGEHICILDSIGFLDKDWLSNLVYRSSTIINSGVSVIPASSNLEIDYAVDIHDGCTEVSYTSRPIGVLLFKQNLINNIGGFEPMLTNRYTIDQFVYRLAMSGFINYYVLDQSMIEMAHYDGALSNRQIDYDENIIRITSKNDYFIPVHIETQKIIESVNKLNDLLESGKAKYSVRLGKICLIVQSLTLSEMIKINHFCNENELSYDIEPITTDTNNVLINRLVLLFK